MDNNNISNRPDEDAGIGRMFDSFDPVLSPDDDFMNRLGHSLDAVEFIRDRAKSRRRATRMAAIAACVAGFICGTVFTMLRPALLELIGTIKNVSVMGIPPESLPGVISWAVIATATMLIAYTAFDLTLSYAHIRHKDGL